MDASSPNSRALSTGSRSISSSLLARVKAREPDAWRRLVKLYGPVIYLWARQAGLQPDDAADVVQEVLGAVADKVEDFRRERTGDTFQGWLWTITRNKIRDHFRRVQDRPEARGGTDAQQRILQIPELPEPSSDDHAEVGSRVARSALELIRAEFEDRTWRAFWRMAIDGCPAADVAEELGISIRAVYQGKYRVLRRIRQELDEL